MSDTPDLSAFDVETGAESGAKLELHDKHGKKSGEWIQLLGADSKEYQRKLTEQNRRRLSKLQKPGQKITHEEMETELIDRLVVATRAWSLKVGDHDFPCTPANAERIYRASKLIREQVEEFVVERANFTPA